MSSPKIAGGAQHVNSPSASFGSLLGVVGEGITGVAKRAVMLRLVAAAILAAAFLLIGGCKYSRLIAFKNSLKNNLDNVQISDLNGLRLEFKRPILEESDIRFLGYVPSEIASNPAGDVAWQYSFVVKDMSETAPAFWVRLLFHDGKMTLVVLSPELSQILSPDLIRQILAAVGEAELDIVHSELRFKARNQETSLISLPIYPDVKRVWGSGIVNDINERQFSAFYEFHCVGRDSLRLAIFGIFRKRLNTMLSCGIVFGHNQVQFGEDVFVITALR